MVKAWLYLLIASWSAVCAYPEEFHDDKVPRDGFDLYYRTAGKGHPVVILSGGPGFDCDYMFPVAQEVAKTNQAILVELRGTGRSLPKTINAETVNLKGYIADLDALRNHRKIAQWTLLGHSAGAMFAEHYAAVHPDHVDTLVLVGSPPLVTRLVAAQGDNARVRLLPSELKELENPNLSRADGIRIALPGSFFDRSKAAEMAAQFKPESLHVEVTDILLKELFPPDGDLRPALRNFTRPVLVITGRQDPLDPGMQYETHLALKNSTLELLPRCGHFPWIEQPQNLYSILSEFLAKTTTR